MVEPQNKEEFRKEALRWVGRAKSYFNSPHEKDWVKANTAANIGQVYATLAADTPFNEGLEEV